MSDQFEEFKNDIPTPTLVFDAPEATAQAEAVIEEQKKEEARKMENMPQLTEEELKELNEVAYVRFAAVYRKFTDLATFMQELQKLVDENKM